MSEHAVFSEDMREIVESFVLETQDILDELNEDLLQLEQEGDASLVDKVFRAVHTVKGTSSFLGLDQLNTLAHHFEDVLNRLRRGELVFRPEMMDVLFQAFDQMTALLQQVLDREIAPLPLDDLFQDLDDLSASASGGDGAVGEPAIAREISAHERKPVACTRTDRTAHRSGSVRVDIDRLDDLIDLVGELTASRNALSRIVDDLKTAYGPMPQLDDLHDNTDRIHALTAEIRSVVLTTRIVTVDRIFSKFPRVARDLGRSLDKDIRIACTGSDTPIDRSLADEIGEALLHLIRNAIDHGIERRDLRRARNKPEGGTITLRAEKAGDRLAISVEDDGRGLDPEAIRRKAAALGRLSEREADELSDSEIYDLIWEPGFSTTDVANRVSGRGVGMDVVRTTVSRVGGSIDVQSTPGHGMRITLLLPSSLPDATSD